MITMTENAAKKAQQFLNDTPEASGFRIEVIPGGCAGYSIKFGLDNVTENDLVFESNNIKIMFNKNMEQFLIGSVVEYSEELNGTGFNLISSKSKGCCGCGKSQCF